MSGNIWLKTLNLALAGRQPKHFNFSILFYFIYYLGVLNIYMFIYTGIVKSNIAAQLIIRYEDIKMAEHQTYPYTEVLFHSLLFIVLFCYIRDNATFKFGGVLLYAAMCVYLLCVFLCVFIYC